MGFECLTPPGFSENLSFGSSACLGAWLRSFNPRGKNSFMPVRLSLRKSSVYGGKLQCWCVQRGAYGGAKARQVAFETGWTELQTHCSTPLLLTLQPALRRPPSDSDSEAATVWLQLLAWTLSLLGGGEEQFINLFGTLDGFLTVCNNRVWAAPAPAAGRWVLQKQTFPLQQPPATAADRRHWAEPPAPVAMASGASEGAWEGS